MRINTETVDAILREGVPSKGMSISRAAAQVERVGELAGFTADRWKYIRKKISKGDHIEPAEAEKLAFGLAKYARRSVTLDEIQAAPRGKNQDTSTKFPRDDSSTTPISRKDIRSNEEVID